MFIREIALTVGLVFGVAASQAQAQDRWAGPYAGIGISAGKVDSQVGSSGVHEFDQDAVTWGLYGGYNFVRTNGFVWGPELMVAQISAGSSATDTALGRSEFGGNVVISPRLRLGYATDKFLFYGVIGVGISDAGTKPAGINNNDITAGAAFGVGMEMALKNDWSIRIEAMSYDLNSQDYVFNGSTQQVDAKFQNITFGLT